MRTAECRGGRVPTGLNLRLGLSQRDEIRRKPRQLRGFSRDFPWHTRCSMTLRSESQDSQNERSLQSIPRGLVHATSSRSRPSAHATDDEKKEQKP